MKIRYASDIHLEFSQFPVAEKNDKKEIEANNKEILLVAGDTVVQTYLKEKRTDKPANIVQSRFEKFLEAVSGFKKVYMIAGNHEAYQYGDVSTNKQVISEFINKLGYKNIHFLENERVSLTDKTDLLACTLWTDMDKRNPNVLLEVSGMMNDFYICNFKGNKFTTEDAADLHEESKKWLTKELLNTKKDCVVMTHHLPSFLSISPEYKGDVMNFGYASEMEDFIHCNPHITHWIHGHTHFNVDYKINNTRILGNMRGYPSNVSSTRKTNWQTFKLDKWFEIL